MTVSGNWRVSFATHVGGVSARVCLGWGAAREASGHRAARGRPAAPGGRNGSRCLHDCNVHGQFIVFTHARTELYSRILPSSSRARFKFVSWINQ
jgi:hypothetical protein